MTNVTIRDVAKKAGVGVGTVSRVLNQSPSVSSSTRQKVLAAIEELEFTPSPVARQLSLGKSISVPVTVMAPFFIRPSYVERLRGIESVLTEHGYDFILYNVETVERRDAYFQDIPRQKRTDGLLIMSLSPNDETIGNFKRAAIPTVLIDCNTPHLSRVVIDDIDGGYKATRHLIDLGHRKIAYITDFLQENPFNFQAIIDRNQGYRNALDEAGLPFRPEYCREGKLSRLVARQQAHELLTQPDPPTAIFTYSDTQAIGVFHAARELNLRVPEDLSVIGYDDIELAEYLHLTTIRQHLFESGIRGAELLLEEIGMVSTKPRKLVLPTELIVRGTTGPPANEGLG